MTCHSDTAQLALDTLLQKPVRGIPAWLINPMEWAMIDRLAGKPPGATKARESCVQTPVGKRGPVSPTSA